MFATHSIAPKRPTLRCAITTRRCRGKGTTFTHDGRNRLIKAERTDGTTMHYGYNPDGMRIESVKNPSSISAAGMPVGGTRTRYVLSGSEEVADLDANKNALRYFIPGPAIDERVAQIEANGAVTFMHTDRQNSVVAISDSAGNVISRRGYGTYGETDPAQMTGTTSAGSSAHPFGYTGRRWDPDLNLYYYRARWYDPQLGTFLQTDPIGALDYINLYSYVALNPTNATDPTGLRLRCDGSRGFCILVNAAITRIESEKNGKALISKLRESKFDNVIRQAGPEGNRAPAGPGGYSTPTSGTAEWDYRKTTGGTDVNGSNQRPAFIGLVHELGHVRAYNLGRQTAPNPSDPKLGTPGYIPPSERHSVANENAVRAEQGLPLRSGY